MRSIIIFIAALVIIVGCHSEDDKDKNLYTKIDLSQVDEDFVLPSSLWSTLEGNFPELTLMTTPLKEEKEETSEKKVKTVEEAEEEELLKKRPSLDSLRFTTFMVEKTVGLLDHHNFEITFAPGGGTLDLKDYYSEKKNGTFFLKVKYDQPMDSKKTKVYYLSNAPFRPNLQFGSGCNKYFDITKFWKQAMKVDGLSLNTVNQRHLSILAGTFIFVSPVQGKLRLGHLLIKDSRHLDLLCKPEIRN